MSDVLIEVFFFSLEKLKVTSKKTISNDRCDGQTRNFWQMLKDGLDEAGRHDLKTRLMHKREDRWTKHGHIPLETSKREHSAKQQVY